jgi:catecholate siderophore receptor
MQSEVLKSNAPSGNPALYPTNVGRPLANIAHQSFNVLTKYKIGQMWEVGGQATYVSKMYGGTLAANVGTELPAHWRFDTFMEAKLTDNITAKLSVNNIFNTVYYDGFYRSATPFVLIAPGRSAQLSVLAKF